MAAESPSKRPRRLARPRTPPFHGDNTGSNPVGDANKTNNLEKIEPFFEGLKGFDKKSTISLILICNLLLSHNLPHYPALCRSLYLCHGLRVHIHRHLEVGMAKKLLDRLHVFSVCLHQGSKGVAQRVPAHRLRDADGFQCRLVETSSSVKE